MKTGKPVVALIGPVPLVEPRLQQLLEEWLSPTQRAVDCQTFRLGECALPAIVETLRQLPMAGAVRVVVLRGIEDLTAEDAARLAEALRTPVPTGRLVLVATHALPAGLRAACTAVGHIEEWTVETPAEKARVVRDFFTQRSQRLTPEAVQRILRAWSDEVEPAHIVGWLEQLSLYAGTQQMIGGELVERFTPVISEGTVFELVEAIGAGAVDRALQLVATQAREAWRVPDWLGFLGWHFRRLWRARVRLEAGQPPAAIARELRLPRRVEDAWMAQVRRWSLTALRAASDLLLEMDTRVKRGRGEPQRLFEETIVTLATVPDAMRDATSSARPYSGAESLCLALDQSA